MNLLDEPWIPVERASGKQDWIAPYQITERNDPPVRLAAARPDFNGALIQFLIGLVQTTTQVDSPLDWEELFEGPPTPEQLKAQFETVRIAFELDGDGARFMQDLVLNLEDGEEKPISGLLIDAPGEQSLERNVDHFSKRGAAERLCSHCVATALFTLQTNAPAGGQGHRTSLRGGGPLTTLIVDVHQTADASLKGCLLWKNIWLNVLLSPEFLASCCNPEKTQVEYSFPWLGDVANLQTSEETQPENVHPAQMYWAMPRRIRLDFSSMEEGRCAICGRGAPRLVSRYWTKNYGFNYKGAWRHPLSPYYQLKASEAALPLHPQPGGFSYKHWLGWVLGTPLSSKPYQPAFTVKRYLQDIHGGGGFRLWAFGYDMDNMKARCWYETTMPVYDLGSERIVRTIEYLQDGVGKLIGASELMSFFLRCAVRDAWFGDGEARGSLDFLDAAFWSYTEASFYRQLEKWIGLSREGKCAPVDSEPLRNEWMGYLRSSVNKLFGDHIERNDIGLVDPKRNADAYRQLQKNIHGPKLNEVLGFSSKNSSAKKVGRKSIKPETGEGSL